MYEEYEELVNEHYKEPLNGKFDDVTASVLRELLSNDEPDLDKCRIVAAESRIVVEVE